MDLKLVKAEQREIYDKLVQHVMQSWEWGEFRKSLGTPVLRYGLYKDGKMTRAFQLTLHKIPFTSSYVGYLPKGPYPDNALTDALVKIGREHHCAFIKVEPDITNEEFRIMHYELSKQFRPSPKPLFTKYNFVLDLTQAEEDILKKMHPKFRYNIKIAQKHGVIVEERTDDEAFRDYLSLYFDTTKRQGYHGHNEDYHRQVWKTLKEADIARLLVAYYKAPDTQTRVPLVSWMLFVFKDTLYYPYGGSSEQYKNVMASSLVAWEAVKLGKKLGFKKFDLWGAADPAKGPADPFFGFTRFKSQLGAERVEYIGTYDLVLNWPLYLLFTSVDKLMPLKLFLLRLTGRG